MFVEAGAGSGKTTCLVDRFVGLVEAGVEADRIAAITFTEKAAGELADRIRNELQTRSATSVRCRAALPALDRAAICTLHAFALRLLSEHPIEARLPPRVAVLDEIASQLAFEARWDSFVDRIIEDDDLERPLRLLLAAGARVDHLREVAVQFGDNWDLVAERMSGTDAGRGAAGYRPLLDDDELVALGEQCTASSDELLARLGELGEWASELRAPPTTTPGWSARTGAELRRRRRPGRELARHQPGAGPGPGPGGHTGRGPRPVQQACLERIAEELARFTVDAADQRRAGELEFHDLLVLARAVLRDPVHGAAVRAGRPGAISGYCSTSSRTPIPSRWSWPC